MFKYFEIHKDAHRITAAIENIPVFNYAVTKFESTEYEVNGIKKEIPYYSKRAPMPGYCKFIIPKGANFYYTKNDSLTYLSDKITLESDVPLTAEQCIEICNFPKSYENACARLGIKPLAKSKLIEFGLDGTPDIALKKLQTVSRCINAQYGIDEYDFYNPHQQKWFVCVDHEGNFHPMFVRTPCKTVAEDAGCKTSLFLPFHFAVEYVCKINSEFSELYKTYLQAK
jgi:hypothetical protein